ncbi:MAG: hypothetical protein GW938_01340 [Leptospira sp.]|nr:hypothetical protein [Leptospira sp.]NCS94862.1 hypothetical protein [Leptospira sp.]
MAAIFQKKWIFYCFQIAVFILYTINYFKHPYESRNHFESVKWIYFSISILVGIIAFYFLRKKRDGKKNLIISKNPILFFLLPLFIFYSSSKIILSSMDTHPSKLLPFALHYNSNFLLDPWIENSDIKKFHPDKYFALPTSQGYLSAYPMLPAYMNYLILELLNLFPIQIPSLSDIDIDNPSSGNIFIYLLEKFSSSFYASLTSLLLLIFLSRRYSFRTSLIAFILFSFATNHYSNSSQTLWQHGIVEFFLVISLLLPNLGKGIVLSLLFLVRPNSLILAFPILLMDKPNKNSIVIRLFTLGFGLIIGFLLNLYVYGHFMGGYPLIIKYLFAISFWNSSLEQMVIAFYGLLFSPAYGLFVFSPIYLMSFITFRRIFSKYRYYSFKNLIKIPKKQLQYSLSWIAVCSYLIFYSMSLTWHGGFSYGYRYLTDANIFLIFLIIPSIQILLFNFRKRWNQYSILYSFAFFTMALVSIYIQNLPTRNIQAYNVWQWEHKDEPLVLKGFDWRISPILVEILTKPKE